ncbi:MAG: UbiX family flavin prenyltransferase [Bacteroidetes bacterium]|nr:UbiX family flavin prenyltransferase [Bacteroidota bacterium]
MKQHKVIIGITGASGAIYGKLLLERLDALQDQVEACGVIFSENAKAVWKFELGENPDGVINPGGVSKMKVYKPDNFFAPMASGSAGYDVMIICPCTMGTLGRIASGVSSDLLTRAADVMLKERKKLILVPREAPFSLIHLNNMKLLTEAGAIICPASPSFYSKPASIRDLAMTVVDRVLALAGFDLATFEWGVASV